VSVRLRVDVSQLTRAGRAVNALLARGENMRPVMEDIAAHLEESTRERFETQRAPDGTPWMPSGRALRQAGTTLTRDGHLNDDITRRVTGRRIDVGTNMIYAATHQFGATIRPKTAKALAFRIGSDFIMTQKVEIPARPFLGISAADEDAIGDLVNDYLTGALQ